MDKKPDIPRVHKIEDVYVSSPIDLDSDLANKKLKGENKDLIYYAVDKDSRLERLFDTILDIIAGNNKAGKGLGKVKDVITWIFPTLLPIDVLTDEIGDQLKSKRGTIMNHETILKKALRFLKQPSTRTGLTVLTTLITGIFTFNINPDVFLNSAIGIVTGLSGIYAGVRGLQEVFRDEDKPAVQP